PRQPLVDVADDLRDGVRRQIAGAPVQRLLRQTLDHLRKAFPLPTEHLLCVSRDGLHRSSLLSRGVEESEVGKQHANYSPTTRLLDYSPCCASRNCFVSSTCPRCSAEWLTNPAM